MQFLQYLETVASNLTAANITNFITLTDNLISLAESVFEHQSAAVASSTTSTATTAVNPPASSSS